MKTKKNKKWPLVLCLLLSSCLLPLLSEAKHGVNHVAHEAEHDTSKASNQAVNSVEKTGKEGVHETKKTTKHTVHHAEKATSKGMHQAYHQTKKGIKLSLHHVNKPVNIIHHHLMAVTPHWARPAVSMLWNVYTQPFFKSEDAIVATARNAEKSLKITKKMIFNNDFNLKHMEKLGKTSFKTYWQYSEVVDGFNLGVDQIVNTAGTLSDLTEAVAAGDMDAASAVMTSAAEGIVTNETVQESLLSMVAE